MSDERQEATELEFLQWFWEYSDFGPADGAVRIRLMEAFEETSCAMVPKDYRVGYLEPE